MSQVHPQQMVMQPGAPQMMQQPVAMAPQPVAMAPQPVAMAPQPVAMPVAVAQPVAMAPPVVMQQTVMGGKVGSVFNIQGYNISNFDQQENFPPPPFNSVKASAPRPDLPSMPVLSEDEARSALSSYVVEKTCYGKKPLMELYFTELKPSCGYHYILETFTESRSARWKHKPFMGEVLDGPANGPAPKPWDITVEISKTFSDFERHIEIPHTAFQERCHVCLGTALIQCTSCAGSGRSTCYSCGGAGFHKHTRDGNTYRSTCSNCGGSGTTACEGCHGRGRITCTTCDGRCNLKVYIQLTITWRNHVLESVIEKHTDLPKDKLVKVSGKMAFEEKGERVGPINHCKEPEVNQESERLLQKHKFQQSRTLQQRHTLRMIPVTKCLYNWRDRTSDYVVYGSENRVYAPNYPQQCCWGCTIL